MNNNPTENLHICHVNYQSLLAHLDEFRDFVTNSGYNIICLSETWLRPSVSDHLVRLQGYYLVRRDRTGRAGGGVAFYIQEHLRAEVLLQSDNDCDRRPEFIIAKISAENVGILLAVVYRPPHCGFLADFFNAFQDLLTTFKHLIIFGDFNADLCSQSFDAEQIQAFVDSSSLSLVPFAPTHHTKTSSTWLDLCIIDDTDKLITQRQLDVCFLPSHELIDITYKVKIERFSRRQITIRDLCSFDSDRFLEDFNSYDWRSIYLAKDIDETSWLL